MKRPGALELLDRCADSLRRLPGAVALLWLTALPSRLILVHFVLVLRQLGSDALGFRDALQRIANAYLCTWLLAQLGRLLFTRALLGDAAHSENRTEGEGWRELLRAPLAATASHIYAAAWPELLFWLTLPALIFAPIFLVAGAIAPAAASAMRPGLLQPLTAIARAFAAPWMLFKLALIGLVALLLAGINLHVFAGAIAWLSGAVGPLDPGAVAATLSLDNPLYRALLVAGASLLVEPFWLGMVALQVDAGRSARTGEDLRRKLLALAPAGEP